jgi:glucosamine--fructose-6-phosphate aminotransferase (isomerizing)
LLWITSQSGRSAELIPLIDYTRSPRPGLLLATVNDLSSPLASTADITIPIDAPAERTVSTRTYLNTLAITQLAALAITAKDASEQSILLNEALADCLQGTDIIADYLKNWQDLVAILKTTLGLPDHLIILGRGPSLASVLCGSLILAEAGKMPSIAMNAAEYRHGPLEMVRPNLTFLVFNGAAATAALNQKLISDLLGFKAKAFVLHDQPISELPLIQIPASKGIALPISEMITMQLLTIAFAELQGLEPGKFYQGNKVVLVE